MNFRSDNEGCIAEPIMQAIVQANKGTATGYAEDPWTAQLEAQFAQTFATEDLSVIPLTTGTAANAIALAEMCPPWGSVACHTGAHIQQDECGAPEFFNPGCKLAALAGDNGKLQVEDIEYWLSQQGAHGVHQNQPAVISLTQASESGTVYQPAEIKAITGLAHSNNMSVHMDGARFANAVAHLECHPADISWRAGVDVLSFGLSKNGCLAAEALLVFGHAQWLEGMHRRRKRAGHLLSKMRYVSAQLLASLEDDLWLQLASTANAHAQQFADAIKVHPSAEFHWPVQGNEVFLHWPKAQLQALQNDGFEFHFWPGSDNLARFVFSCTQQQQSVDRLCQVLSKMD